MTAAAAPVVAHNRFPVTVACPDGTELRTARMVLTADTLFLMVWTRPGDPAVDVPFCPAESTITGRTGTWEIDTPDGAYRVLPGRGCGCGSPLKRYEPFSPMTMGQLP